MFLSALAESILCSGGLKNIILAKIKKNIILANWEATWPLVIG